MEQRCKALAGRRIGRNEHRRQFALSCSWCRVGGGRLDAKISNALCPTISFSKPPYRIFELRKTAPAGDTIHVMLDTYTQKMVMCCCTCSVSSGDGVQSS